MLRSLARLLIVSVAVAVGTVRAIVDVATGKPPPGVAHMTREARAAMASDAFERARLAQLRERCGVNAAGGRA